MRPDFFDLVVVGAAEAAVSVHFDAAVEVAVVPLGGASLCRRLFVVLVPAFACWLRLIVCLFILDPFSIVMCWSSALPADAVRLRLSIEAIWPSSSVCLPINADTSAPTAAAPDVCIVGDIGLAVGSPRWCEIGLTPSLN